MIEIHAATDEIGPTATRLLQGGVEVTVSTGAIAFLLAISTAILGLYISYQAYRGYQRNRSRPMLFLAVGIVLLTFVPSLAGTVAANLDLAPDASLVLSSASQLVGLLAILYGIKYA